MQSRREPGFEILRVLSMLFIVISHYMMWGTTMNEGENIISFQNGGINAYIFPFFSSITSIGVICFVLISSYYLCDSNVLRFDRIAKVYFETLFYSILLVIVVSLFTTKSLKDFFHAFTPLGSDQYWFVTKYIALVILAPVMSIIVNSVSRKGLIAIICILCLTTVTITHGVPYGNVFFSDSPFSVATFIFIFFISAYEKKYHYPPIIKNYCGWIFILFIAFQGLSGLIMNAIRDSSQSVYGGFSISYNALSLIPGTALFLWFKKHTFKDSIFIKFITGLAPYTFAVYLIHDNPNVRPILWTKIFNAAEYWQSPKWTIYLIIVPAAIMLLSCALDLLRVALFKLVKIDYLIEKIKSHNIAIK